MFSTVVFVVLSVSSEMSWSAVCEE